MMWDWGWGWHWFGAFGMAVSWLLIVLMVLGLFKYLGAGGRGGTAPPHGKTARDYLDEAYAKGEISREEFLQKREDLRRE